MLWRRFLMAVAAAAVAGLFGPAAAKAGFTLTLSEAGHSDQVINSTPNGVGSQAAVFLGDYGDFTLNLITSSSTADGGKLPAVLTDNAQTTLQSGVTSSKTLTITVEDQTFQIPTGLANVATQLSFLSALLPPGASVTEVSYINGTQVGPTLTATPLVIQTGDGITTIGSAPYTIKNVMTITLATGGDSVQVQGNTTVTAPAPATAVLALAGAPLFGLLGWVRRRKAVVA